MADDNTPDNEPVIEEPIVDEPKPGTGDAEKQLEEMADRKAEEKLKPVKAQLDKAFAELEELRKEKKMAEDKAKLEELAGLEKQGKQTEADAMRLSAKDAEIETLRAQLLTHTRDRTLSDALDSITEKQFKSPEAKDFAFKYLLPDMIQDEEGVWKHKASGLPIKKHIEDFSINESNDFLFKPITNKGAGTGNTGGGGRQTPPDTGEVVVDLASGDSLTKQVTNMSMADLLKAHAEGKIRLPGDG